MGNYTTIFSPWAMINRNVLLLLFAGLFGWLAAYSFEKALLWAEQTKEDALDAHAQAFEKEQIAQAVSYFLNEVVTAFAEQANGRMVLLSPRTSQQDPFAPYVQLLNERLRRFEQLRTQSDSWNSVQIQQALKSLSITLHKIATGSLPVQSVSPHHFQTGVEPIDEIANQIYILLFHQTQQSQPQPSIEKPFQRGPDNLYA